MPESNPTPIQVESYFSTTSFHELFDFAEQYSGLDGVAAIVEGGKQDLVKFDEIRKRTINDYQPKVDSAFSDYQKAEGTLRLNKTLLKVSIAIVVAYVILGSLIPRPTYRTVATDAVELIFGLIGTVALLAIFVFAVLVPISKHVSKKRFSTYHSICGKARSIGYGATREARASNIQSVQTIDAIYLSTLSIADREAILMRRAQQQQLEEQRAHQQRVEETQREVAETQRQIQRNQEELLEYERDRQRRMGRY